MKLGVGAQNGLILPDEATERVGRDGTRYHLCLMSGSGSNFGRMKKIYRSKTNEGRLACITVNMDDGRVSAGWLYGDGITYIKWVPRPRLPDDTG